MSCGATETSVTAFDSNGAPLEFCIPTSSVLENTLNDPLRDEDTMWLILAGCLVFLMQVGFAMLEVGTVRARSVENILFKNLADACLGAIIWWSIGWGLAYGVSSSGSNEFSGTTDFTAESSKDYRMFFFQWCFAATAATIVSGAVAERITIQAYFFYTIFITGFIYPIVCYWGWSDGFLWYDKDTGMIDFAGSGIVHMVGGFSGLMGAIVTGPRRGATRSHSVPFQVFGTFILWFGWYGFNCGSTLGAQQHVLNVAERVAATTTLSAASGGISAMILSKLLDKGNPWSVTRMCNGILGGLVSITANCSVVGTGSAVAIGFIGGCIYYTFSRLLKYLKIDDVLDATPVHGFCGMWGLIAAGLFAQEDLLRAAYESEPKGFGKQLRNQFLGAAVIGTWTIVLSGLMFITIKYTIGLNIDELTEKLGIDNVEHGGQAWSHTPSIRTMMLPQKVNDADIPSESETELPSIEPNKKSNVIGNFKDQELFV